MTDRLRAALAEVTQAATAFLEITADYDKLLGTIVRTVATALDATCSLTLFDDGADTMTPVAVYDEDPAIRAKWETILTHARPIDMPLVAAIRENGVLFVPELDLEEMGPRLSPEGARLLAETETTGMIMVLMPTQTGPLGTLTVMRRGRAHAAPLDDIDRELAQHLATFAGLALANANLFRKAQHVDALRRSEARAHELSVFLDTIVENIPDMIFVKDASRLSFVRFNKAGEDLLGFPRSALLGKNDFDFFPKEEAEFFVAKDRETLRNGQLVDIPEEPIQTATGPRWLHTKKVPILDPSGEPRYLLGISEDITDRKRDLATLRAAKETAEAANKELESFSYSVAHDLRTPLRSIDGFTQALLEDYSDKLGEVGRSYCTRVRNAAQRMAMLIDDLLKLSRVTRSELRRSPVDLDELFRNSIATLQRLEPDRRIDIATSGDLAATGDPKLLSIVFDNLCSNAWKFTSRRSDARIELGTQLIDGERVFFVRDNGVGFDMAYASKLFGVFQRFHSEVDFPGTGIGLATVHRILTRHNGRIWADAAVDRGATFLFTLGEAGSG